MSFWTPESFRAAMGGTWLARAENSTGELAGLSTDSRAVASGQAFIALRGARTDGHLYLREVAACGAALLVVDRPEMVPAELAGSTKVCVLAVPDTGAALLRLGAAYRQTLDRTRVVAVGGSNGKTSTVGLIHAALSTALRGSASQKSFNNAVGVPLTLLGAKRTDQYLVCEVGTNAPGEIAPLTRAAAPDVAVITSIGREHLDGLGSLEGVLAEELTLLQGLRAGGLAVLNADAPGLVEAARPLVAAQQATMLTFGTHERADLRITACEQGRHGLKVCLNGRQWFGLPLLGRHQALNVAATVAVARRLGVDQADIERGLARAPGAPMRLQRVEQGGVEFINDAYNANPESVHAALATFAEVYPAGGPRRVVVLGDMLEQGGMAPQLHREVLEAARALAPDLLVLVGKLWPQDAAGESCRTLPDLADRRGEEVAGWLQPGDAVLLKGSRGMALERIVTARARLGTTECSTGCSTS